MGNRPLDGTVGDGGEILLLVERSLGSGLDLV
jgi:hypothetical protein